MIAQSLYRIAISLWTGGVGIFTFILTPIIFKSYDRDVAGKIVGVLFPAYFRWGLACGTIAVLALLATRQKLSLHLVILGAMLLVTSVDAFFIEPRLASLKKEIPSFVTTPKDDPRRKEFSRLHGISAISNLAVFSGGIVLLVLP